MHRVIEMQVRVYQTRHDELILALSYLFGLIFPTDVLPLSNRNNISSRYDNRTIPNDSALAIYRHHGSAREDNICFNQDCGGPSLLNELAPNTNSSTYGIAAQIVLNDWIDALLLWNVGMLDIRKLRYFKTVAELGSFTKAAMLLRIAQPALSRQIQQLEEELGLELLQRQGRQFRLTDSGEAVLLHARTIGRDFERLREDMQARNKQPKGRVIVGIPPTLATTLVFPLIDATRLALPLVTIKIMEGLTPVLTEWVRNSEADMAILSLVNSSDGHKIAGVLLETIANEDMIVVEKARIPPPPAVYEQAILSTKPIVASQLLTDIVGTQLGHDNFSFNIVAEVDSAQAIKTMVLKGQAATILPVSMFAKELRSGVVVGSAITSKGVRRTLALAQPSFRQTTQAIISVRHVIKQLIQQLSAEGVFSLQPVLSPASYIRRAHRSNSPYDAHHDKRQKSKVRT
jgi:LysR family nitrogen assimilation transcriptional regulator